jgi:FeS assembly ATPase SufC
LKNVPDGLVPWVFSILSKYPGVSMVNFLKTAVNEHRKYRGEEPLTASQFLKLMQEKKTVVEISSQLTNRSVNEGFSGGRKKRNEIFQMAMLEPKLSILDETDSGLDIDALRIVANGVNTKTPRKCNHRDYPLPTFARLHCSRFCTCFVQRPHRKIGR